MGSKYNFGTGVTSDWTPGSRFEMSHKNAPGLLGEGEILETGELLTTPGSLMYG